MTRRHEVTQITLTADGTRLAGAAMFVPPFVPPKPIPDGPTCCRGCGCVLPLLRRWGGLCAACVAARGKHQRVRPDPLALRWTELARYVRKRNNGERETVVRVRCQCGTVRIMDLASWNQRRTLCCARCRLAQARTLGVESDYGR